MPTLIITSALQYTHRALSAFIAGIAPGKNFLLGTLLLTIVGRKAFLSSMQCLMIHHLGFPLSEAFARPLLELQLSPLGILPQF